MATVGTLTGDRRLALLGSPGLPSGARSLGEVAEGAHNASLRVQWTPARGQEGLVFPLCFQLYSMAKPALCAPVTHCLQVYVIPPSADFQVSLPPRPSAPPPWPPPSAPELQCVLSGGER
jgi:hypothetical protein